MQIVNSGDSVSPKTKKELIIGDEISRLDAFRFKTKTAGS